MEQYFVNQKRRKNTGEWTNLVIVKNTENEARHQAHAFMSTYAYEQDANVDYCSVSVTNLYGATIVPTEVDNRIKDEQ